MCPCLGGCDCSRLNTGAHTCHRFSRPLQVYRQRPFPHPNPAGRTITTMAPKGKKVERKEENISLGPQIQEGVCSFSLPRTILGAHPRFKDLWIVRRHGELGKLTWRFRRKCIRRGSYFCLVQRHLRPRHRSFVSLHMPPPSTNQPCLRSGGFIFLLQASLTSTRGRG